MRLFAAIEIPVDLRNRLQTLTGGVPGARWVEAENYHLTLRFIGAVDRPAAEEIDLALAEIDAPGFALALAGVGQFGTGRKGRAIWIGVDPEPALVHLARKIDRAVVGAGLPPDDRNFMPHVTIGADAVVGAQSLLHAGVCIGDRCVLGDRVIVHANAVIGSDGFSFAPDLMSATAFSAGVKLSRVHSLGNVVIGDDVEIGACTTIDRATLESTRIGNGTKIDNQVHIGHNVSVGES